MIPVVKTYRRYPSILNELLNDQMVGGRVEKHCHSIPVNIKEVENEYEISLSAPGLSREDLKVSIDKNTLTISYEKPEEKENKKTEKFIRKEFSIKSFKRSFELPENSEIEKISAKNENGILYVSIPKKAKVEIPVQKIEVK